MISVDDIPMKRDQMRELAAGARALLLAGAGGDVTFASAIATYLLASLTEECELPAGRVIGQILELRHYAHLERCAHCAAEARAMEETAS